MSLRTTHRVIPNCRSTLALMLALGALLLATSHKTNAQGCVAARGAGISSAQMSGEVGEILPPSSGFQGSVGYRWFQSDRHFVGDQYQSYRDQIGDQVINNNNFIDLGVAYSFSSRFSVALAVPFVDNDRSQVLKDSTIYNPDDYRPRTIQQGGPAGSPTTASVDANGFKTGNQGAIVQRYHTDAAGLGDLRLQLNGWVLDPKKHATGNVLVGLGVVMPTGDSDSQDTFPTFNNASKTFGSVNKAVDQSIQPGNGGWGILLDMFAYQQIIPRLNAYVNGGYVITPEERYFPTGVATAGAGGGYSISDTYYGRAGLEYRIWPKYGLTFSLGPRIEGVPTHDLTGGSLGFRRPGYAVSIEPGIGVSIHSWSINVYTPVAIYRNRERSVPDEVNGTSSGDAAYADYSVLASIAYRF